MSDPQTETSLTAFVTSEEVACQTKAVADPLAQHLAHLCDLMQELRNEQAHRRYDQTAYSRTSTASAGSAGGSDTDEHLRGQDETNS